MESSALAYRDAFLAEWLGLRGVGWAADLIPDLTNLETRP